MLLPLRSKNPPERFPIATLCLIGINVLVYAFTVDDTLHLRSEMLQKLGLSVSNFSPFTLFTHLFVHADLLHLAGNLWFLYLFGFATEGRLRTPRFLLLYFASGIVGAILELLVFGKVAPNVPLVGASGAIMGVLGAALYLFPHSKVEFFFGIGFGLSRLTTWNMAWVAAYYLGLDFLFAVFAGRTGVAHLAHLGGAACGFAFCALFQVKRDSRQASDAKATYHETKDLSLLTSCELAAMAESNPDDTAIALNWMYRNLRDGAIKPECLRAFMRLLPDIIQREPAATVGFVLACISSVTALRNEHVLHVAFTLEHRDTMLALRLYDEILKNPASSTSDMEGALFRKALLCEIGLKNRPYAVRIYQQLIERFPMSPMAEQAKLRLSGLPA